MDSTTTLIKCESENVEACKYVMVHNPKTPTDQKLSFASKLSKCRLLAGFFFILFVVILLYQAPVVLYYANISPNIDDSDITNYVDFKTCSAQVSAFNIEWCICVCNE